MKSLIVLGVSGSIGRQTVSMVDKHPDLFQILGVSVHTSINYLETLLQAHDSIQYACVYRSNDAAVLAKKYPNIRFFLGDTGLVDLVQVPEKVLVVNALVGFVGLRATLATIEANKDIALGNKESLVCGGELIARALQKHAVSLYPIDSEHSAIQQCLQGESKKSVRQIILTGSGGPFRDKTLDELECVTKEQALRHPNWQMGAKISIDSATLMNKALEIIEAHYLFQLPYERIQAMLHYESIVHGLVEFQDGSIKASLGMPSMEIPILYALSGGKHILDTSHNFSWDQAFKLRFRPFDFKRFPAIELAYQVGRTAGTMPTVFNGANEVAVAAFLEDKISFHQIIPLIQKTIQTHHSVASPTLKEIIEADSWARLTINTFIEEQ